MKNTMGEFLSALRKANGYSQQEVADLLYVSNKTVSSWERDITSPDLSTLPLIADLYGVTCDELIRGAKNANNDNQSKLITESNIKIILTKSLEKFKRSLNICYIILFSSFTLFIIGILCFFINLILSIVLIVIFVIAYIVCFFLLSNFLNIAYNASSLENESEEIYLYNRKIYLMKRKIYNMLICPILLIILSLIFEIIFYIGYKIYGLFSSNITFASMILVFIGILIVSILLIKNRSFKEIALDLKYNASGELKNKILFNHKMSKRLIKIYFSSLLALIIVCFGCKMFLKPAKIKIKNTEDFINYMQTYREINNNSAYGVDINKLIEFGYTITHVKQPNNEIVVVYENKLDNHIYIFVNDICKGSSEKKEININNNTIMIYSINRDAINYEYKNNVWEIYTQSAEFELYNRQQVIYFSSVLFQVILLIGFIAYYSLKKEKIILYE